MASLDCNSVMIGYSTTPWLWHKGDNRWPKPRGRLLKCYRVCDTESGGLEKNNDDKLKDEKEEGIVRDDKKEKKLLQAENKCDDEAEQKKREGSRSGRS